MSGGQFLVASVISIQNSSFVYPSCHGCLARVSLQFKRYAPSQGLYNCQKCGCSGYTKEANYRYRLSLEVADTHDVFEVTVFGSCLDTYFGVKAKGLQRYIEELNRVAGEDENDAVVGVVYRAVETCFTGKKFVFKIKSSDEPSVASLLQNGCQTEKGTKTLIACEMFVPHPELMGHTVMNYMEQQHSSQFKQGHRTLWLPDHLTASDHSSRELKSLHLFNDWDATQSHRGKDFSALWPDSFGLSWSSVSSDNAERSAAFAATSEREKCQGGSATSARRSVYDLSGQDLTRDQGYAPEGKKPSSYPSPPRLATQVESGSQSSRRREGGKPLGSPLDWEQEDSSYKISNQSRYERTNPQPAWPHQRSKGRHASTSSPDARGGRTARQASSEGFTEFRAQLDHPSYTADLPNRQEWRPASGLGNKSGQDKGPEEPDNSLRRKGDAYCSPRVGSSYPEPNFDASEDLFDVSGRGSSKTTSAKLSGRWAGALTPNRSTSDFRARRGKASGSWSNSNYGSSFYDAVGDSAPNTSTPIAESFFKSEGSLGDTLDYTPNPHSHAHKRPYHPDSLPSGKRSILSNLPPGKLPWGKAKCKRPKLPSKDPLVKQPVGKFSTVTRSSNAEAGTVNPPGPPELLSEDDSQEWSPPSETIQEGDVKLKKKKRRRRRRRRTRKKKNFVGCPSQSQETEESPLLEKQGGSASPSRLPIEPPPGETGVAGQSTGQETGKLSPPATESLDEPSFADDSISKLLPSPSAVPHVADWSSELFPSQDHLLPNAEASETQPTC